MVVLEHAPCANESRYRPPPRPRHHRLPRPRRRHCSSVISRTLTWRSLRPICLLCVEKKAGESEDCVHLVSSHANDVGLTALHLDPLPKGPARAEVAETFYLVDLADSALAAELKEAGKSVVYQVRRLTFIFPVLFFCIPAAAAAAAALLPQFCGGCCCSGTVSVSKSSSTSLLFGSTLSDFSRRF